MQVKYLIIGQGISGTWLSYFLSEEKVSFVVIDDNHPLASSRLSAGIINPVTGRRHVEVWMADELLPFVREIYTTLGNELQLKAITQKDIIDFFPSVQMRVSFELREKEDSKYVSLPNDNKYFSDYFRYDFGYGKTAPAYTVHLENILPAWRKVLTAREQLLEEKFDLSELIVKDKKIIYKDIIAEKIIFCDGNGSQSNPWFQNLPFAPNKGEALIVNIPSLPIENIYKKGMILVPLATENLWWLGASYEWSFENAAPTARFRKQAEEVLRNWIKLPFTIIDHICGIRPATLERRPFVGLHPVHPQIGILNGMGTKGCSLAPFFAKQFVEYLLYHKPILPEADIKRFSGILSRS